MAIYTGNPNAFFRSWSLPDDGAPLPSAATYNPTLEDALDNDAYLERRRVLDALTSWRRVSLADQIGDDVAARVRVAPLAFGKAYSSRLLMATTHAMGASNQDMISYFSLLGSSDGVNWDRISGPAAVTPGAQPIGAVARCGGAYVVGPMLRPGDGAPANSGIYVYSAGTWTNKTIAGTTNWCGAYDDNAGNCYLLGGTARSDGSVGAGDARIAVSSDGGASWGTFGAAALAAAKYWRHAYVPGVGCVAVTDGGTQYLRIAQNGAFAAYTLPGAGGRYNVCAAGNKFVLIGDSKMWTSSDGIAWTQAFSGLGTPQQMAYAEGAEAVFLLGLGTLSERSFANAIALAIDGSWFAEVGWAPLIGSSSASATQDQRQALVARGRILSTGDKLVHCTPFVPENLGEDNRSALYVSGGLVP